MCIYILIASHINENNIINTLKVSIRYCTIYIYIHIQLSVKIIINQNICSRSEEDVHLTV